MFWKRKNKKKNEWYEKNEFSENNNTIDFICTIAKYYAQLEFVNNFIQEHLNNNLDSDLHNYIKLDTNLNVKGHEHLEVIYKAIKDSKIISFKYKEYDKSEPENHLVLPHVLKQENGIFYLLAKSYGTNKWQRFGLDRIQRIYVRNESFTRDSMSVDNIVNWVNLMIN